jgi:RNA polymerase sigma factor (sigma-70 family)
MTEARLWQQWREERDEAARTALIEQYRPLVPRLVRTRFSGLKHELKQDLTSEGYMALVRLVDRYDPAGGAKFSTYAFMRLWGQMVVFLKREGWTVEAAAVSRPLSLDERDARGDWRFEEMVDERNEGEDQILSRLEAEQIARLISRLPERHARVLHLLFWGGQTLREVASAVGCSLSGVHYLEAVALSRLRHWSLHPESVGDMKGSTVYEVGSHWKKLTPADVQALRGSNEPPSRAAARLGVSADTIRRARNGATWSRLK